MSPLDTALLFAVIFTSYIKFPVPGFEGVPLWMFTVVPVCAIAFSLHPRRCGAMWIVTAATFIVIAINVVLTRSTFPDLPPLDRQLISAGAAALTIGVLAVCGSNSEGLLRSLFKAIKIFLVVQLVVMLIQIATDAPVPFEDYRHYFLPINRQSGIILEPSHVAVVMAVPLAILVLFPKVWFREFGFAYTPLLAVILFLCPSSTLAAVVGVAFLLRFMRGVRSLLFIGVLVIFVANYGVDWVIANKEANPLAERVSDLVSLLLLGGQQDDSMNVSAIAFAKSYFTLKGVLASFPLGSGYDNFIGANALFAPTFTTNYIDLNERDATSFALKFMTEFGWAGLLVMGWAVFTLVRAGNSARLDLASRIVASTGLCLLLANTVRGGTYFFAGLLLTFALVVRFAFLTQNAKVSMPAHTRAQRQYGQ